MAFRGFTLQPKNPQTQRQLLRTLLPRLTSVLLHGVTERLLDKEPVDRSESAKQSAVQSELRRANKR